VSHVACLIAHLSSPVDEVSLVSDVETCIPICRVHLVRLFCLLNADETRILARHAYRLIMDANHSRAREGGSVVYVKTRFHRIHSSSVNENHGLAHRERNTVTMRAHHIIPYDYARIAHSGA
jgi:hypothetical protein